MVIYITHREKVARCYHKNNLIFCTILIVYEKLLNMVNREMEIKTTMGHHFTSIRMALIKKWKISNVGEDV